MEIIQSQIQIQATPEKVWQILTDLRRYSLWNPFIQEANGELLVGRTLIVRLAPKGSLKMEYRVRVLTVETNHIDRNYKLAWLGHFLMPRLLDGENHFMIEALDGNRARLIQIENFSGLLLPLLKPWLANVQRGYADMLLALKVRAEAENRNS